MRALAKVGCLAFVLSPATAWSGEVSLAELASGANRSRLVGHREPNRESMDFLIRVLEVLDAPYSLLEQNGETVVYWAPQSSAQEQEVSDRVSQFSFIRRVCPSIGIPSPSDRAREAFKC